MARAHRRRLFVSFGPPEHVRELLQARCQVRYQDVTLDGPSLSQVGDAEAAMVTVTDRLSAAAIGKLPASLRAIATYSVGFDHIDLAAAEARDIAVLHTPDVLTTAVAENAIFMILAVARRATESIALVRSGAWPGWTPTQLLGFELRGKTLGVFGLGRIGREIARLGAALGLDVLYHDLAPHPDAAAAYRFLPDLDEFLAGADMLVLAAPSTPRTRGIINADTLAGMRRHASIINVARGDLVDDDALIAALSTGRIAGAALDVFANEPRLDPRYGCLPNVFMLPHIGSSTVEARRAMAEILLDGMDAIDRGERPPNQIV